MSRGFTLIEVTIALGIFAFCIVAIIGLLQVALNSSRASYTDSSLCNILANLDGKIRSTDLSALGSGSSTNLFFDVSGNPLSSGTSGDVYFRATFVRVSDQSVEKAFSVTGGTSLQIWSGSIAYPAPAYRQAKTLLIGKPSW